MAALAQLAVLRAAQVRAALFGTGHFRLVADGADTLLTLHPNPDFGPTHTIRFLNVAPSAFTAVTGAAHWDVLIRARAIETQCYVLAAAQGGTHPGPRETFGHAAIVDPWGRIVAEQAQGEAVLLAERDIEEQASIRARMPVVSHRRFFSQDALRPAHTSE